MSGNDESRPEPRFPEMAHSYQLEGLARIAEALARVLR